MAFGWLEFRTFIAGMEMFTLMAFGGIEPVDYGLGASRTTILFFLLPVVTGFVTFTVSWCERVMEHLSTLAKQIDGGGLIQEKELTSQIAEDGLELIREKEPTLAT